MLRLLLLSSNVKMGQIIKGVKQCVPSTVFIVKFRFSGKVATYRLIDNGVKMVNQLSINSLIDNLRADIFCFLLCQVVRFNAANDNSCVVTMLIVATSGTVFNSP